MPLKPPSLILASGSAYRRELLSRLQLEFSVITSNADESPAAGENPADLARRLAYLKASAVANDHPGAVVIGSDQVAALNAMPLGKPGDLATARKQLLACSGQAVEFHTAVCVLHPQAGFEKCHTDLTTVEFRTLGAAEIDAYLNAEKPFDCAGSFKSEGLGVTLFDAITNQDPTALIGLPLIWLAGCLRSAGLNPLQALGVKDAKEI
jgi:septum formation protein